MADGFSILDELDAETRAALEAEAQARGLSLYDYVNEALLTSLLAAEKETPGAAPRGRGDFAVTHRLDAVERRLQHVATGVDTAIAAFDQALVELGARVDDSDRVVDEEADRIDEALAEVRAAIDRLGGKLDETSAELAALSNAHDAVRAQVLDDGAVYDQRLSVLEEVARGAEAEAVRLSRAQEELKRALASDFIAHALEVEQRLETHALATREAFAEQRKALDAAQLRQDNIVAGQHSALATLQGSLEQRFEQEARRVSHLLSAAAQASAAELACVSARLDEAAAAATFQFEALQRELAAGQVAREEASREADLALAAARLAGERRDEMLAGELARAERELRLAQNRLEDRCAESVREAAEAQRRDLAALADQHAGALAHLRLLDQSAAAMSEQVTALRLDLDVRLSAAAVQHDDALAGLEGQMLHKVAAFDQKLAVAVKDAASGEAAVRAEIARVEACTLAALEAGAERRNQDAAAFTQGLDQQQQRLAAEACRVDAVAQQLKSGEAATAELKDQIKGALARQQLTQEALMAQARRSEALEERLARAEDAARAGEQLALAVKLLQGRADAQSEETIELREQTRHVAHIVSQAATQHAEAAAGLDARVHTLELALADLRLEHLGVAAERNDAFAQIDALRADLAAASEEAGLRLAALEQGAANADYDELRRQLEDRSLALEARTVRALDQLAQTLALLSRKFGAERREDGALARSA